MRARALHWSIAASSLLLALGLSEAALRFAERRGLHSSSYFSEWAAENIFFHQAVSGKLPPRGSGAAFDARLGWRASPVRDISGIPVTATQKINSQSWRSPTEFSVEKRRRRVAVVGDSFIYGPGLEDSQTIPSQLESFLGDTEWEVLNFSAVGYGLDQMAVLATEVAPKYDPDYLVLAFIEDDLRRSCLNFIWDKAKPYFELEEEELVVKGRPVLSFEEMLQQRQSPWFRWRDGLLSWLASSHVVSLTVQPWFARQRQTCLEKLNPRILQYVSEQTPARTQLYFVLLDGELPHGFEEAVKRLPVPFVPISPRKEILARQLGVIPGTIDGLHPDARTAKVYAHALAESLALSVKTQNARNR